MVVGDFNIMGVTFDESKANAQLVVDGYSLLACSIASQPV
jgi:hypothetical protein